jgi:light-regulated signal transduction histidine kinase (bacteriophytochrome)
MWSVDREYKLIMSNTRFDKCIKQMTGKRIPKGGAVLADGFSGAQLDRFKVFYDRAFAGEIFKETEYISSPAEVWSEISFYPIRNGDEIIGAACHSRDISDIKRNEEKLTSTNKDLETFIYRASHDLRSPLCSIMGLVEVSSMEIQDKTAQQYLKMIGDATKKLDNILLGFVRVISVKDAKASYEEISINRLIDDTLKKLENNSGYSRMNITKMGTLQSSFVSNRVVIESIFQNIMENAIKYQSPSLEKPILNILVWEKEKEVCFAFVDNGIGFDSSYLEKVFEMYFRASQEQEGSGLGLYLVNIGVKKLGGKIDVWSEKGKGAKFIVSLPLN